MTERKIGYLYCALAMASVGSTIVASKLIAAGLPPFTATMLRFAIAFPIFLLAQRFTGSVWPRLDLHDRILLVIQAGAGSVGYTVLLVAGMRFASAADAGVIAGTLPIVSAAIAMLALGEKPRPALLCAAVLATAGVLVCTVQAGDGTGAEHGNARIGDLLIFGAVACEGIFILLNKRLRATVSPLQQSTAMTGIGFVLAVVPALLETPWTQGLPVTSLAAVAFYALVPTVGGFLLWYAGSSRLSGAEAGLLTALVPISAMILAVVILGESIRPAQLFGIACVLAAVVLAALSGRPHPEAASQVEQKGLEF